MLAIGSTMASSVTVNFRMSDHSLIQGFGAAIVCDTSKRVRYLMVGPIAAVVEFGELDLHATQ
jgi:hypothetical protein